jgi:hypothetical protein
MLSLPASRRFAGSISAAWGAQVRSIKLVQVVATEVDMTACQYAQLSITRDIRTGEMHAIWWRGPGQGLGGELHRQRAGRAGVAEPGGR